MSQSPRVFQTRFKGTDGNCWPACLATIFGVDIEDVDHCSCGNEQWSKHTDEFLARRGLYYLQFDFSNPLPWTPPHDSLVCLGMDEPFPHVVVGKFHWLERHPCGSCKEWQVEIVHDPAGMRESFSEYAINRVIVFGQIIPSFIIGA